MAEPDFSMPEEPAWLRESQKGSFDFLRPYVAGKEHRLNERRVSIAEEQLAANLKAAEQDYRMKQFAETDYLRNREMVLRAEEEAEKLLPQIESLLAEGGVVRAYYQLADAGVRNPNLAYSKRYNWLKQIVEGGLKFEMDKSKAEELEARYRAQSDAKIADIEARERIAIQQRESIERVASERNKNRLEISQMRGGAIQEKLTPEDAAAMRAEFTAARDEGLVGDALQQRIDEINAKYSAKRTGTAVPERKELDAIDQREEAIQDEILQLQLDLAKEPKKGMLDFGQDNRVLKIKELQRELRELNQLRGKPTLLYKDGKLLKTE